MLTIAKNKPPPKPKTLPVLTCDSISIIERDYLSPSAISTFQRCPFSYACRYIHQIEPEFVSSSLVFGTAIHSALECYCLAMMAGGDIPGEEELLAVWESAFDSEQLPIRYGKSESRDTLVETARRCLKAFLHSDLECLEHLIGVEETLREPIFPGCPDILGRIDAITFDGSILRIIDFKTSRNAWSSGTVTYSALPMLLYVMLAEPLYESLGAESIELEFIVLTKSKSPRLDSHPVRFSADSIDRASAVVRSVWSAIQAGNFYPAPGPQNCSMCPYRSHCDERTQF